MVERASPYRRLRTLLTILRANRNGMTARELGERLECDPRQIRYDLAALRENGTPITHVVDAEGRWHYRVDKEFIDEESILLSTAEMVSVSLGEQMLAPLAGTPIGDGLTSVKKKMLALRPAGAPERSTDPKRAYLVKQAPRHSYSGQGREVRMFEQAIEKRQVLNMTYFKGHCSDPLNSEYDPYGLVVYDGSLYVIGRMAIRDAIRTLKVERIRRLDATRRTFEWPSGFSLEEYLAGSFGIFAAPSVETVVAQFTGWAATILREERVHGSQEIINDSGDFLVARFVMAVTPDLINWFLSRGRHARVLEPSSLARDIDAEAKAIRRRYSE